MILSEFYRQTDDSTIIGRTSLLVAIVRVRWSVPQFNDECAPLARFQRGHVVALFGSEQNAVAALEKRVQSARRCRRRTVSAGGLSAHDLSTEAALSRRLPYVRERELATAKLRRRRDQD